jgi:gliding motility-associated-like protein
MRKIIFFLSLCIIGMNLLMAQAPGCPSVFAGNDTTINCAGTVQLNATALHTGLTNTYAVSSIPYTPPYPFNTGTPILVNIDDRWSPVINLPFNFCFFGNTYNQIVAGSNGCLSFSTVNANQYCAWSFSVPCPNPNIINGSTGPFILGPFHDIDPGVGGSMYYALLGSYPCRTFVVNYYQVPMFSGSCNYMLATHQIVLYESTNVIEVYMQNAPLCPTWNSGNKVIGIQNTAGTIGFSPPGRNTGPWSATNEAWRFTPNGSPNYAIQWYQGVNAISPTSTVTVSPTSTTTYTAVCVYDNCDGTQVTVTDDVVVTVANPLNLNVTPMISEICEGDSVTISASGAETYSWSPTTNLTFVSDSVVIVSPPVSTTYTLSVTSQQGLCTGTVEVFVYVNPPPAVVVLAIPPAICSGDSTQLFAVNADNFVWNDMSTQNPNIVFPAVTTTYSVTGYDAVGCSNTASVTVNVSDIPNIQFSPSNPSICDGDEATITASGAQFYFWSNMTTANPLVVSPSITTSYTVTGTDNSGVCSSSAEVTLVVNDSPTPQFSVSQTEGCIPLTITFYDESILAAQWQWNFGDLGTSTTQNPTHVYNTPGTYDVTLTVTSSNDCEATIFMPGFIEAYPQPIADFTYFPEIGKTYNSVITFYSNTTTQYWLWKFGDGEESNLPPPVTHTFPSNEASYQVTLVVSNDFGCIDSVTKTVIIIDDILIFPNVITPNGDGKNDVFEIINSDKFPNSLLQVYNRWGKLVFEQQNYGNKWDGSNLADGTYFYIFKYLDKVYNGSLTILRN